MFRLAFAILAVIGLVSLVTGGVSGLAAGAGLLFLVPVLFVAGILSFMMLFGFFACGFARRRGSYGREPFGRGTPWRRRERPERAESERRSRTDDFEEWHRLAHAREEVDSWAPEVD